LGGGEGGAAAAARGGGENCIFRRSRRTPARVCAL